jgi:hypothetical protein
MMIDFDRTSKNEAPNILSASCDTLLVTVPAHSYESLKPRTALLIPAAMGAGSDRGDGLWLSSELVPSLADGIDGGVVGVEDAVGKPVGSKVLPDIFERVQFVRSGRQEDGSDIVRHVEIGHGVPPGAAHEQHGLRTWSHMAADLVEVELLGVGISMGKRESSSFATGRTDRAEEEGALASLIGWRSSGERKWATQPRPAPPPPWLKSSLGRHRPIAGRSLLSAPRSDPSVPDSGTRLLPWVFDGEALVRPGVKDVRFGKPVIRHLRYPLPGASVLLAATPQRPTPQKGDMVAECHERTDIGRHRVVGEEAGDDLVQPSSLFGNRPMHPPS